MSSPSTSATTRTSASLLPRGSAPRAAFRRPLPVLPRAVSFRPRPSHARTRRPADERGHRTRIERDAWREGASSRRRVVASSRLRAVAPSRSRLISPSSFGGSRPKPHRSPTDRTTTTNTTTVPPCISPVVVRNHRNDPTNPNLDRFRRLCRYGVPLDGRSAYTKCDRAMCWVVVPPNRATVTCAESSLSHQTERP